MTDSDTLPAAVAEAARWFQLTPKVAADYARRLAAVGDHGLTFSVVIPIYKTAEPLLEQCVGSVRAQAYPRWELIVVDDCPEAPSAHLVEALFHGDDRLKVIRRKENGGIAAATNDGVRAARGDFIVLVDHDDELTADALLAFAEKFLNDPDLDACYSDQATSEPFGVVLQEFHKPDWSPTYLLGAMYVGHLLGVRTALCKELLFDSRYDGVQDFEFTLRLAERTQRIGHLPEVLYRWRAIEGSLASDEYEKAGIDELQVGAVRAHLKRRGLSWSAQVNPTFSHRVALLPGPGTSEPRVSIVIPSRDQGELVSRCLDSIYGMTEYGNFEVVIVDNRTVDPVALAAFERHPVRRCILDRPFNYSAANNTGVQNATGDLIVFLNNDTEILEPAWLQAMAMFFEDSKVGAVGATLLYPDRTIQHAGVVLGARGTADHAMRGFDTGQDGYYGSLSCTREVSAVTAACMMVPRRLFEELGGFSEDFAKHYQDVDLCMKIRHVAGRSILNWAGEAAIHYESVSRSAEGYDMGDRAIFIDRWFEAISEGDPYFIGFDLNRCDYTRA